MQEPGDRVFVVRGDEITTIPSRSMREGILGKSLEDALQTLFENYPEILPGYQIAAGSLDPPRFVLLRREMPVGSGWSLDHLYVDQYGVLTLVETKLAQNPESRRDVIGQIIEYAANANSEWRTTLIRERATQYWQDRGQDLKAILEASFGPDFDEDEFWHTVDSELERHNIRLMIAADRIRPEVRRMIEYLNSEMRNAEVLGLELECYAEDEESLIVVPRLVGQSSQLLGQKSGVKKPPNWSYELLRSSFADVEPSLRRERLEAILQWANAHRVAVYSPASNPAFGILGKSGVRVVSLYSTGEVYALFETRRYASAPDDRRRLLTELLELRMVDPNLNIDEIKSGKTCTRRIEDLSPSEFDHFFKLVREVSGT